MSPPSTPSPGNAFSTYPLQMKTPHMVFIYRLDCEMSPSRHLVGAPFNASHSRLILPIVRGTVKGPRISGVIQEYSGADWATAITNTDFMRLDARYVLQTDDGHLIAVRSKGVFQPRRDASSPAASGTPASPTQENVDWFTRLQFETGPGPYEWMNGVFGIGVLAMHEGRIQIDAYQLTNFPEGKAVL